MTLTLTTTTATGSTTQLVTTDSGSGAHITERRNTGRAPVERVDYSVADLRLRMLAELSSHGWWFDTSGLTAADTAAAIRSDAHRRAVITP